MKKHRYVDDYRGTLSDCVECGEKPLHRNHIPRCPSTMRLGSLNYCDRDMGHDGKHLCVVAPGLTLEWGERQKKSTIVAMLKHAKKRMRQRKNKPLAKHGNETYKVSK